MAIFQRFANLFAALIGALALVAILPLSIWVVPVVVYNTGETFAPGATDLTHSRTPRQWTRT
jgi:hypothetical protein